MRFYWSFKSIKKWGSATLQKRGLWTLVAEPNQFPLTLLLLCNTSWLKVILSYESEYFFLK